MLPNFRRIKKGIRNLPHLIKGFNIYFDPNKLHLINHAFTHISKGAKTFADLGVVWKVNGAYTFFTLEHFNIEKGFIVDTHFNDKVEKKIGQFDNLVKIKGDFRTEEILNQIGKIDVVYFFDVLLHQVNPDWIEVLLNYSLMTDCFLIFNQQYNKSDHSFNLTQLPLETYKTLVPARKDDLFDFIFDHRDEINTEYNRPWITIPDIFQWAITDTDLRKTMKDLGYEEIYFKNCGHFSDSRIFENHAFIFVKKIKIVWNKILFGGV